MTIPETGDQLNKLIDSWQHFSQGSVSKELKQAKALLDSKFMTESGLRLGRATEAALYSTARELGISLSDKSIQKLGMIREKLSQYENEITQSASANSENDQDLDSSDKKILNLAKVSSDLSKAIWELTKDKTSRVGVESLGTKNIHSISKEILRLMQGSQTKTNFKKHMDLIKAIFKTRNDTAHSSHNCADRELESKQYFELLDNCELLLNVLLAIHIGAISEKNYNTKKEAPESLVS
ncbi:hypothetical protein N8667_06945 [Verrucomicrobia bacterium]|nr:hypothetical protein [Verrucomicrobiota bacterium]